ncbi:hypothetical protein AR1Y2_1717 [Anaerostipes rhamnosivorans]|uniref:Uncharacterized protein n=1 Tax=Anaerostipes rhamnosivorans TaxID=1229621 RepID=A0A4P8IEC0_9FIRM|nr:hypothetical protein AR1Y2_1717 [Anaerostipes rhamnosivorans]
MIEGFRELKRTCPLCSTVEYSLIKQYSKTTAALKIKAAV